MYKIKNVLFALLSVSFGTHAGYVLETTGDITIGTRILVVNGVLTDLDNPAGAAVFQRDDNLGLNDLIIRASGTIVIDHVQIAVIGGNLTIESDAFLHNGHIYLNSGALEVNAADITLQGDITAGGGLLARGVRFGPHVAAAIGLITIEGEPIDVVFPLIEREYVNQSDDLLDNAAPQPEVAIAANPQVQSGNATHQPDEGEQAALNEALGRVPNPTVGGSSTM